MKTTIQTLLIILALAFFSCQKNDGLQPSAEATDLTDVQLKSATMAVNDVAVESASDEVNSETYFYGEYEHLLRALAHMKGMKNDLFSGRGNMHYINGQLPVVSIDTAEVGYPITITIEYGTNTKTKHGKVIKGTVIIEISGDKNTDGSTRTITYKDCMVDSVGINGTCIETFNGDNTTLRMITVDSDVNFTLPDGTVLNRVGNNVREWLQGLATPFEREDDMIRITGTTTVNSSTGDKYDRVISAVNPLIRLGDCHHPVQGLVQFYKNDVEIASVDYGDGTCDNKAELTTDGTTVEIVLNDHGMPKAKTKGQHKHTNGNMGGNGKNGH
jgi:hypothetical protein